MDGAVQVVAHVSRKSERDRGAAGRPPRPGFDERAAEPGEIAVLGSRPFGKGHRGRIHHRITRLLGTALPGDREIHAKPLEDPADEPVVAGAGDLGRGGDRDPARVRCRDDQVRRGRMELDGELGLSLLPDRPLDRPDGLGKGRAQPRLDIGEQGVGGRDPWDEASTGGLTREPRVEGAGQHRRHGSPDSTPRGVSDEHAVGTTRASPRVRIVADLGHRG